MIIHQSHLISNHKPVPIEFSKHQIENFKCFLTHIVHRDLGKTSNCFAFHLSYEKKIGCNLMHLIAEPTPSIFHTKNKPTTKQDSLWYEMLMDEYTIQQFMKTSLLNTSIKKYSKSYGSLMLENSIIRADTFLDFKKYFHKTDYYLESTDLEKNKVDAELELYTKEQGLFFKTQKIDFPYRILVDWIEDQVKKPFLKWHQKATFTVLGIEDFDQFNKFFDINKESFLSNLVVNEHFLNNTQYFNSLKNQGIDFLFFEDGYLSALQQLKCANYQSELPTIITLKRKIT